MQSRKEFLKRSITLAAGSLFFGDLANGSSNPSQHLPFTFDFHCHPGQLFAKGTNGWNEEPALKTVREMNQAHLSAAFFSLVADAKLLKVGPTGITIGGKFENGQGWQDYKRQLEHMKGFLQTASVKVGQGKKNINTESSTVTAFISVEGGDFLEGNVDYVDEAFHDGVRSIQLVHYAPNDVGDLQTAEPVNNGLSNFGKQAVKRMNKLGIVVDVAHANFKTVQDVVAITDSPIILSHSILEMESDRPIAQRSISKEHAKLIAKTGGVIGAWPSGFNKSFEEYIENTIRLVDVVGIDHVGIGTDMDANFKPVFSSYLQYPDVAKALKDKGLSNEDVGKIMGNNAKRVLSKIFKS
jgi:membrane dipeptidase